MQNLNINHIGMSVPNLDDAINWYSTVFGFCLLRQVTRSRPETPDSPIFTMYGPVMQKAKIAFMTAGNGIGFELFEFVDPQFEAPERTFEEGEFTRGGLFHFAITVPDVGALADKAVENGGRQICGPVGMGSGEYALYVADPWGNVIECMSCSFELLVGQQRS
ncbi:Glyoxalase/Bleomycin resistance protein/Dihydroxybiphenyl dioxygenase [Aspergillus venezuelensis]